MDLLPRRARRDSSNRNTIREKSERHFKEADNMKVTPEGKANIASAAFGKKVRLIILYAQLMLPKHPIEISILVAVVALTFMTLSRVVRQRKPAQSVPTAAGMGKEWIATSYPCHEDILGAPFRPTCVVRP
jgi:hypothetical protein